MTCAASIYLQCDWKWFWMVLMFTRVPDDTSFLRSLRLPVKGCLSITLRHGLEVWADTWDEGKCLLVTKWTHKAIVYRAYRSTLKMSCPKFWRVLGPFPIRCWLQISTVLEKLKLFSFKVCSVICDEMGTGVYIQFRCIRINGKTWFTMYLRAKMKMFSKLVIWGEKAWLNLTAENVSACGHVDGDLYSRWI